MPKFKIRCHAKDNNGKRAEITLWAQADSFEGAAAYAAALVGAMQAVSTATFTSFDVSPPRVKFDPPPPGPDSDARSYTLLFYRDGTDVASVGVPSAGNLPYQDNGPYAGIRVTRSDLALSGLLGTVEAIASGLVRPDGRAYPTAYSVGGRVEL